MYEAFYGLNGKPFQLNPDPSFFFASKGHNSAFSFLKYGVYQGEGFIVITGDIGAGKTTVVRALLEELDPRKVIAVQLVSTQLEADDLVRSVAVAFGVPIKGMDKAQLLVSLETYLTSIAAEGKRALLIVDEAQNLSARAMEELRMLSNFQIGEHGLLQSFLVGQPELREMLRSPGMQQLRQRIIASYHLGPMDAAETRGYIEHRLHKVGWDNRQILDDAGFAAVHATTGGIPRRINQLSNRLLLAGFLAEKPVVGATDVETVAAEIREELGGVTPTQVAAPMLVPVGAAAAPPADAVAAARAVTGDNVVRSFGFSSIAARLDRLEKTLNTLLELVRSMQGPAPERRGRATRQAGRE